MSTVHANKTHPSTVYDRYQHNLSRDILGVANYLQTQMMDTLQSECGHNNLRLSFAPYITLIGGNNLNENNLRVSELAEVLGISRQACNQAAQQVEAAGYIQRTTDPQDGRAKQLALTDAGFKLRRDGVRIVAALDNTFSNIVGGPAVLATSKALGKVYNELNLGLLPAPEASHKNALNHTVLGGLLPRMADYILLRLMKLTQAKGHPGLKLSFAQVLPLIGPAGGRIQNIAAIQDVSKQAISAIATELEELGYLRRDADPNDARQLVLQFTELGEALLADSVRSTEELEAEFAAIIGKASLERVKRVVQALHNGLPSARTQGAVALAEVQLNSNKPVDLQLLAKQLQQQLGTSRSGELATLLLK